MQIATLASCSFDDILDAAAPGQTFFLQLYVNRDREITRRYVQHAERRGVKGLFITVDAPQLGRREKDMRMKFDAEDPAEVTENRQQDKVDRSQGAARAISVSATPPMLALVRVLTPPGYPTVIHRPRPRLERHPMVQEHHK